MLLGPGSQIRGWQPANGGHGHMWFPADPLIYVTVSGSVARSAAGLAPVAQAHVVPARS